MMASKSIMSFSSFEDCRMMEGNDGKDGRKEGGDEEDDEDDDENENEDENEIVSSFCGQQFPIYL